MNFQGLIIFLLLISLNGCGLSERESKYKNMPIEQKQQAYLNEKIDIVYSMICEALGREIDDYKLDRKNKEFKYIYFTEYPSQFEKLQHEPLYPLAKKIVSDRLKMKGVKDIDPDFKEWQAPEISELPCKNIVDEWKNLKIEWDKLKSIIPSELRKKYTFWDQLLYSADEIFETILKFIVVVAITAYSIALHFALIVRRNKDGLWLIITTPLSAIYWKGHLNGLYEKNVPILWKIFISSIILSILYSCIALIIGRLIHADKKKID